MSFELKDVTFAYPGTTRRVLTGISIRFERGTATAVMGPSGCGKTTLLALLGLLETPTSGTVMYDGIEARPQDRDVLRKRGIRVSWLLQTANVLPRRTALANASLEVLSQGATRSDAYRHAQEALMMVGLQGLESRSCNEMSGGQRQRVCIARVFAAFSSLVIADEPTAQLDADTAAEVASALVGMSRAKTALVIATHDRAVADLCDRVVDLTYGRI